MKQEHPPYLKSVSFNEQDILSEQMRPVCLISAIRAPVLKVQFCVRGFRFLCCSAVTRT